MKVQYKRVSSIQQNLDRQDLEGMDRVFEEKDSGKYVFGGMEVHSTNVLRVISELESAFQMLKYLGFEEDMIVLQEMKSRYYKMYFKLAKQEKSMLE